MKFDALRTLLRSRTRAAFDANVEAATEELHKIFPRVDWGIAPGRQPYSASNYANLWGTELQQQVRLFLEENGKTATDYQLWLQEIQVIWVGIYSRRLFPTSYQLASGWRLSFIALPAVKAVGLGVASYYQDSQSQGQIGRGSNLLFDIMTSELGGRLPDSLASKVSREHWNKHGLIPDPVTDVCEVDVTSVAPKGLELGDVRVSTVKKHIASFITMRPLAL